MLDPNVLIQESKVGTCDIRPGRRPTGPALLDYVEDYRRRAGITSGPADHHRATGRDAADGADDRRGERPEDWR